MIFENLQNKSDEDIVSALLQDKEAFTVLVKRYQEPLTRYLRRLGLTRLEDAEDVLQNVFLKAYRSINDFDRRLKFSSWIYRIAHNEAVSYLRTATAKPSGISVNDAEQAMERIRSDIDLNREAEQILTAELIASIFPKINKKYQDVLILRFFEERSYNEISDILRIPSGSVATLLNRAKKMLRKELTSKQRI
ncbi:MAG: sigma-70 family RNA polymerase sigma factor [Patescibacteria group bacterium]